MGREVRRVPADWQHPVMESPETLARWLVDNNASAFANRTASYEEWLHVCQGNWVPGLVIQGNKAISGVEFTKENFPDDKNED